MFEKTYEPTLKRAFSRKYSRRAVKSPSCVESGRHDVPALLTSRQLSSTSRHEAKDINKNDTKTSAFLGRPTNTGGENASKDRKGWTDEV